MSTDYVHIHRDGRILIRIASLATAMEIHQVNPFRHMVPIRLEDTMAISAIDAIPFGGYRVRICGII